MRTLLIAIILMLICWPATAEMYQWTDENGVITFRDTPPPQSKKPKKIKVYSDSDYGTSSASPTARTSKYSSKSTSPPSAAKQERFTGTVEMYATEWCGYCKKAERYMQDKGIPFVTYDIEKDNTAKQRHKALGGRGVPLIIIGSNKMSGFSAERLEHYLNNSK